MASLTRLLGAGRSGCGRLVQSHLSTQALAEASAGASRSVQQLQHLRGFASAGARSP